MRDALGDPRNDWDNGETNKIADPSRPTFRSIKVRVFCTQCRSHTRVPISNVVIVTTVIVQDQKSSLCISPASIFLSNLSSIPSPSPIPRSIFGA
jgi:hypothetical protein